MDTLRKAAAVIEALGASETAQIEALRQALVEGERSGEPQSFDFAAFTRRKAAQYESG